ncbi:hypothetical protein [Amycolatopsis sp. FDAARGOS 1241]|uniref:hypothetical protein n=1 Tax=Amycolatopsis sp. FDAARGOS 1241 TaxID=2778070 RepID=UPI001951985E|nr:hypothetical protein [Amycolatopsis sp. FDAARGOS 1241]QRP51366.1 hypothetical protein I6J71_41860 [Amycolatopsis sp. FDAARGOS 1241]
MSSYSNDSATPPMATTAAPATGLTTTSTTDMVSSGSINRSLASTRDSRAAVSATWAAA